MHGPRLSLHLLTLFLATARLGADEGMWTFDNLPLGPLKAQYGFSPDPAWLDHVRQAAVRVPRGSASFVSRDGLLLTNHHVAHSAIQQVSGPGHDYVREGFLAASRDQEIKVPGFTAQFLVAMEDITARVDRAVPPGLAPGEAGKARGEVIDRLVAEAGRKTGLRCEPVLLYQGGEVWIYQYKRLDDVRLVMAPEYAVAGFGMDWDNFSYPRHDLDLTFFRVYEDGRPFHPPHHLRWADQGAALGDLVFMVGHPGSTNRLDTVAQMAFAREEAVPYRLRREERLKKAYRAHARLGEAQAQEVSSQLMGAENFSKVFAGELAGLANRAAMERVAGAEAELRARVDQDPRLRAEAGESWARIEEALGRRRAFHREALAVGTCGSSLFAMALQLVRLPVEQAKAPGERLAEFKEEQALRTMLAALKQAAPFHAEKEIREFTAGLREALEELGPGHPFVRAMLGGASPEAAARAAVAGTRLQDAAFRRELLEKGPDAIQASQDPFLVLARALDPLGRSLRQSQLEVQRVLAEHGARIARARFAVYGRAKYPDATFTLRLSYGTVSTCQGLGTLLQPFTTLGGLYDRADAWGPRAEKGSWALPQRWLDRRARLDLRTPYNFLSTHDSIGGNSGSPMVNRQGELVGLAFDGNIDSLPGRYFYDVQVNRSVSVDARGILEVLARIYEAHALVAELKGKV
ncbi:S46 family peptidase [Mesoterricola silvestris]|uniref:Dipeptidyl-peptidase n=1 Tax=Mesoterricola silvestris TaxID=2927979 RepID=A0AA48K9P6_9BACT|nr:S46 family peptidase [Mesoterricola silvestris]BDU72547.1 dipeptidyl-peptidase [Mesoterricola silvestris]